MKRHTLSFDKTITSWDEAIPLGNGALGCLIWGQSDSLRLSIDKNGLWDCSGHSVAGGEYTFENLCRLVKDGNMQEINRIFDQPYNRATPTKLPVGKLIINMGACENVVSRLDIDRAVAEISAGETVLQSFLDATSPVGYCLLNTENCQISTEIPAYGTGQGSEFGFINSLSDLNYPPAKRFDTDFFGSRLLGFTQQVSPTLTYGLFAAVCRSAGKTLIVYTVCSGESSDDVLSQAEELLSTALKKGFNAAFEAHTAWWADFWAQGYICLDDEFFELNYFLGNYLLASCSRKGYPPMPLQGVWTADDGNLPPWKGDYHSDLNTQLCYYSYLKANHISEGESFIDFLLGLEKTAETFARDFFGTKQGLCLPSVMDIEGNPLGGWAMYSLLPTGTTWLCKAITDHFRYTGDIEYLKDRAYPYVKKHGLFLAELLTENEDGRLVLPLSSSPEFHDNTLEAFLTPNSNFDLALLRFIFGELGSLAEILGLEDDCALWRGIWDRLDLLFTDENGCILLSRDERLTESHRHFSHLMAIHPLRLLDYGSPDGRRIIDATVSDLERLGNRHYMGFSYGWLAQLYAIQGRGEDAYRTLDDLWHYLCLPNGFHCNGDYTGKLGLEANYRPFTLEGNFCAVDAMQEMFLFDGKDKTVISPALSHRIKNYSFKLRSKNGVIISASVKNGVLTEVNLEAYRDAGFELLFKEESLGNIRLSAGETLAVDLKGYDRK